MKQSLTLVTVILIDQASKLIYLQFLDPRINSAYFFGIVNSQVYLDLLILATLIIILIKLLYEPKSRRRFLFSVIIAGAISNFIDRLMWGGVIDFIKLSIFPWFNIADIVVVCGIILLIRETLINEERIKSRSIS